LLVRLATVEKGLYGISHQEVLNGRRHAVAASSLRLSRQGEAVAFHIEPDRERFAPGSMLYFVSEGAAANPYGNEAVYELETSSEGVRMETAAAAPAGEITPYYFQRLEAEENPLYQAALVDAPDLWLWERLLAPVVKGYWFHPSGLAESSESSRLEVWFQGTSDLPEDPDHHVRVYVNGTFVAEASWDGKRARQIRAELAPGLLYEGENLLELENVGDTGARYSSVTLNRFEVIYPRVAVAEGGNLEGLWTQSGRAVVSGLGGEAHVLDVTEPARPRWLRGAVAGAEGLSFSAEAEKRYLVVSATAVSTPQVRKPSASTLKSRWNQADYVVIGPAAFLEAAEPLLALRRSQGLATRAVPIEAIYSEFGYGEPVPQSIQDFLTYAYHRWSSPSVRYVLLIGDGTYDFKDYGQTGVKNHVPPLIVKTTYLWTVSDPAYVSVNGEDELPDLAIGRLPAATIEEARAMVEKILAYESPRLTPRGPVVLVADNPDPAGDFVANAEEIAAGLLLGQTQRKIYLPQLGTAPTRSAILQAFDEGAALMSYIGHGGIQLWAHENILNIWDVASLGPQAEQPLLLTMNCLNGYFHFPYFNSLAEELLKAGDKGVIAAFSPSGLSLNASAHIYHKALLNELFHQDHTRLGDAVLAAQAVYADTGAFPELLSIYHLLGDPALTLR
jgi:hypothetical protein